MINRVHENGAINMSINLNEIMEEYARVPFIPYGAHYKRYAAGHRESEYSTRFSSFIFSLGGKATIYLEGKPFTFRTNRVIHCAPDQRFTAKNENGGHAKLFELAYINNNSNAGYMNSSYELEIGSNPGIFLMLQRLSQLSQRVYPKIDGNALLQAKTLTYSILSEMFLSAQSIQCDNIHSVAEDAKSYMEHHYSEPLSLLELGNRYGMSGKYFAHIFKRYTGISPIEYLIACRMDTARKLLQSTSFSVKEISCRVGYEDALYFSRHFKSRFGLSPSEWRENTFKNKNETIVHINLR